MISIIVAIAENGVIGDGKGLLWHISEDLRRFRHITTGHPVVMGRKTFESLGRPLPNRTNVVISRNMDYRAEGCLVVHSLNEATGLFPTTEEIFIIGGGEIYQQAWDMADMLYITWVHARFNGDTSLSDKYIKKLWELNQRVGDLRTRNSARQWDVVFREHHPRGETFEYPFEFVNYQRVQKVQTELDFPR
ncbi:MAG: dihydrofolate reductase [Rikenellaceae bacterium]|jgi:dihydrofolate reductase|nr:dihydrofolate reductase [Rikenellaceae bacterium]